MLHSKRVEIEYGAVYTRRTCMLSKQNLYRNMSIVGLSKTKTCVCQGYFGCRICCLCVSSANFMREVLWSLFIAVIYSKNMYWNLSKYKRFHTRMCCLPACINFYSSFPINRFAYLCCLFFVVYVWAHD